MVEYRLRGMGTKLDRLGRPERLEGRAKLESDIAFIALGVLLERGLLKTALTAAQRGDLAADIVTALEDSNNWFIGQQTPITLGAVEITRRGSRRVTGVAVVGGDSEGNLDIVVTYAQRSVGIEVPSNEQTVVIPFGGFDGDQ
jgi:hypothetical protein